MLLVGLAVGILLCGISCRRAWLRIHADFAELESRRAESESKSTFFRDVSTYPPKWQQSARGLERLLREDADRSCRIDCFVEWTIRIDGEDKVRAFGAEWAPSQSAGSCKGVLMMLGLLLAHEAQEGIEVCTVRVEWDRRLTSLGAAVCETTMDSSTVLTWTKDIPDRSL